jgi:hypothetical protein
LTSKDVKFQWSKEVNRAFEQLKKTFTSAPILIQFDPNRETILEADASGYATRGVLSQYDDEGVLCPCAFFLQKNNPAECNYKIYKKELLTIVKCICQWSTELQSVGRFRVLTDHKNLIYFATYHHLKEWQMRWAEELSQYNFSIAYHPGKEGGQPNALSQREQDMPQDHDKQLMHREASILSLEQFEDWDKAKVNVIIVPLFACPANINEETGSEEREQEPLLSLDNISREEGEKSMLSLDNNSPL